MSFRTGYISFFRGYISFFRGDISFLRGDISFFRGYISFLSGEETVYPTVYRTAALFITNNEEDYFNFAINGQLVIELSNRP